MVRPRWRPTRHGSERRSGPASAATLHLAEEAAPLIGAERQNRGPLEPGIAHADRRRAALLPRSRLHAVAVAEAQAALDPPRLAPARGHLDAVAVGVAEAGLPPVAQVFVHPAIIGKPATHCGVSLTRGLP